MHSRKKKQEEACLTPGEGSAKKKSIDRKRRGEDAENSAKERPNDRERLPKQKGSSPNWAPSALWRGRKREKRNASKTYGREASRKVKRRGLEVLSQTDHPEGRIRYIEKGVDQILVGTGKGTDHNSSSGTKRMGGGSSPSGDAPISRTPNHTLHEERVTSLLSDSVSRSANQRKVYGATLKTSAPSSQKWGKSRPLLGIGGGGAQKRHCRSTSQMRKGVEAAKRTSEKGECLYIGAGPSEPGANCRNAR